MKSMTQKARLDQREAHRWLRRQFNDAIRAGRFDDIPTCQRGWKGGDE